MSRLPILIDERNQWEFEQCNACFYDECTTKKKLSTHPEARR
jgi:hypothetical protein